MLRYETKDGEKKDIKVISHETKKVVFEANGCKMYGDAEAMKNCNIHILDELHVDGEKVGIINDFYIEGN